MSDPHQLDRELREYLEKEPNLRREDRLLYLNSIFNKHFELMRLEHVVNSSDFFEIVSNAKNNFTKLKLPVRITNRQADSGELIHIALIESFLSYLNKMKLVKKLIKFDYTE